jgi:hypothetical protein
MLIVTHLAQQIIATATSGVVQNVIGGMVVNIMFLSLIAEDIAENAIKDSSIFPTLLLCVSLSTFIIGLCELI